MSPKPDSPNPLRSAPERSDPTPELLRSAPEHINIVAPTLQTPLIHMIFPPSCVSHTFGALRPHSGAHQYYHSDAPNPTDTCVFSSILNFPIPWKGI